MRKFNVYKIEGDEKTLLRENASMDVAMALIKVDMAEHDYKDVYTMDPLNDVLEDDVVTYQVVDAEPAFEVKAADKRLDINAAE